MQELQELGLVTTVELRQSSLSLELVNRQAEVKAEEPGKIVHKSQESTSTDQCESSLACAQELCADLDTESDGRDFGVLGMLVAVIDDAASDFVFGPPGSKNRPDGMLDLDFLHTIYCAGFLSQEEHVRWTKFVQVWSQAGWKLPELLQVADELRCLQYGSDLQLADLPNISQEQLAKCIAKYSEFQDGADVLKDFARVVHQYLSQSEAVLLPATDVQQRLISMKFA